MSDAFTLSYGAPARRAKHPAPFYGALGCYLSLVVAFCAQAPRPFQYSLAAAALVFSLWLMRSSLAEAVLLIVLVTHIGPVVQIDTGFAGGANLGDLFVFLCFGAALLHWLRERPRPLSRLASGFLVLAPLAAVSYLFTSDYMAALSPLINLAEFFIAYVLVWTELRERDQFQRLLAMIALTVLVSGCMHLYFYQQGVSLSLASESGRELVYSGHLVKVDTQSMRYFQKTSFFYPTFVASCAVCAVLCIVNLVLPRKLALGRSLFYVVVLLVSLAEGLVQGNRTVLVTTGLCALMILWRLRRLSATTAIRRMALGAIALSAVVLAGYWIQQSLLNDPQKNAFRYMLIDEAPLSWHDRMEIWKSIGSRCLLYPKELIVGMGPDAPLKGSHIDNIAAITYVAALGTNVPSFHNFYIDLVFQFGLVFFIVFAVNLARTMIRLRRLSIRTGDITSSSCLFALAAWIILWNSHATSWTKPTLIFAQLMAVGHGLLALHPAYVIRVCAVFERRPPQRSTAAVALAGVCPTLRTRRT